MSLPRISRRAFVLWAVGLPLALWVLHRGRGHAGDLTFFHEWYLAFADGPAFYRDGPGVNYPIVGALLVCAPSWAVGELLGRPLSLHEFVAVHKAVLVIGEVVTTMVAERLAREAGARRPRALALGLYLLPITWAGGAWFGQTDVWSTAALLAAAAALLRFRREGDTYSLVVAVLSLHAALLLKQLTWFALPMLGVLLWRSLRARSTPLRWVGVLLSPGLWFLADPFLILPDGHLLHLAYIIRRSAGDHGAWLTANGASLWTLLPALRGVDARAPILGPLSALAIGWVAWAVLQLAVGLRSARRPALELVRWAGVGQLSMALFMTGVHDRYYVHAIPLLFLTTRGARQWFVIALSILAGGFVLASVHGELSYLAHAEMTALTGLGTLAVMCVWRRSKTTPPPTAPHPVDAEEAWPETSVPR